MPGWVLLFPAFALAEVQTRGYVKSFVVAQDRISNLFIDEPLTWQSQNSARFMVEGFGERTVWQLHYEVSPVMLSRQAGVDLGTFNVVSGSYRLTDIEQSLSEPGDKNQVYQNLDRLNLQVQFDHGDLTLGRQAISFGAARMINPTDIFLPFDVRTFNTEYRNGVDAVRYQRPWGELGEVDVGLVLGDDADRDTSAAFLQLRGNVSGKDLHFALIEYARQTLVGVGIQSAIGDTGFWFEAAHTSGDVDYVRASMGLDYAFTENTFGQVEYHFNGAGSDQPADYLRSFNTLPYQRGGVFLLGKEYLMPVFTWQASPLWALAAQAVVNLSDQSAFVAISAEFNAAENLYMDFGYYHFTGDDLELSPVAAPMLRAVPQLGSEYGTNPDTVYASLRYYF